jgi:nicotinamide-nucleotide amidase
VTRRHEGGHAPTTVPAVTRTDDGVDDSGPPGARPHASLHDELLRRGHTLATAESLTGGGLADLVSAAPGASATYLGGVVSYASEVKVRVLGVRQATVDEHGVVSAACAAEMATGARRLIGTHWALSTTGVAGPTEQEGKPVGTVHLGLAGPDGVRTEELHLAGDRASIRAQACRRAIELLLEELARRDPDPPFRPR